MQRLPIRDDNLRLVLSRDHGRWLDNEIRDRWIAIVVLLVLVAIGGFILHGYVTGMLEAQQETSLVYMDHDATKAEVQSMTELGYVVMLKNLDGTLPNAQPEAKENKSFFDVVSSAAAFFLVLLSPFLIFFTGKALLEIRKLQGWKQEHAEFLASYNRSAT